MGRQKTVAVIGAGMSGLLSMKSLKEEGFEFVCFESTGYCGGLWRYHEEDVDGVASVMKTTIINSSKEMGAASDFPPPAEFPNYMPNELMYQYLRMIAQKSDVESCIKFYHEVMSITPAEDYQETGKWVVAARDTRNNVMSETSFDGVMVCIGHHAFPNMPSFPGIEDFQGKIMHTHSLKKMNEFEDQRVAVIGIGNSGLDAAVEISNFAKQVYLSSRRGAWVSTRVGPQGITSDAFFLRRSINFIQSCVPFTVTCSMFEMYLNMQFNHFMYNLNPKNRVLSQHPAVSDALPIKLLAGTIVMRGNVLKFTKTGVLFDGEQGLTEVDAVIFATGYKIKFPFLADSILRVENNRVKLYKFVYPPHLPHPTLAIIGLIQPFGAALPLIEMQCRWYAIVMNGKCSLPSQGEMVHDILKKEETMRKRFVDSQRHTIQVDFINYQDELATLFGVKPNFWKMAFTDPKLFKACITGPCLPYQYRLQGTHAWNGARDAILTYNDRMKAPFLKPSDPKSVKGGKHTMIKNNWIRMLFLLLLLWWCFVFTKAN